MAQGSKFKITIETLFKRTGITAAVTGVKKLTSGLQKMGRVGKASFKALLWGLKIIAAPLRIAAGLFKGLTVAMAGAVVEGSRFNIQMARVWTMAGGGIKNFRSLREEARGLAQDFGIARSEIALGMYNALSAGVDQAGLAGFMRDAAKLAVADGSDISTVVDGLTTVINSFKMKTEDSTKVADQFFKTVREAKSTIGELSASLFNVAPAANAANIPLEQILAHIATLTAQGTPTAQATTQIRQSIIGLNKALGDGWSATMTYQDALKKVWEAAGYSQTELLKQVGSTEAMMAVLGGVGRNAAMATVKLRAMGDAAGSVDEAFNQVDQFREWPKALEGVRGAISKFGEILSESIAPIVNDITDQINRWTNNESFWSGLQEKIWDIADGLRAGFSTAYDVAVKIKDALSRGAPGFGQVVAASLVSAMDLAINTLIAGIKSSLEVWKLVGQIIGSAITEAALKVDFPGANLVRENAMKNMPEDDLKQRFEEVTGKPFPKSGAGHNYPAWQLAMAGTKGDAATQSKIVAGVSGEKVEGGVKKFSSDMEQMGKDYEAALKKNLEQFGVAVTDFTGEVVDLGQMMEDKKSGYAADRAYRASSEGQYEYGKLEAMERARNGEFVSDVSTPPAKSEPVPAQEAMPADSLPVTPKAENVPQDGYTNKGHNLDWFSPTMGRESAGAAGDGGMGASSGMGAAADAANEVSNKVGESGEKLVNGLTNVQQAIDNQTALTQQALQSIVARLDAHSQNISIIQSQLDNTRA